MMSGAFDVALSWIHMRVRCPIIQLPLPEVHDKTNEINGLTLQPLLEDVRLSDHPQQIECGITSICHPTSSGACQLAKSLYQWSCCFGSKIVPPHCRTEPVEL